MTHFQLSDRALLASATISLFSGEKVDKRVAEEVARNHNTTASDAGRFNKAIISKKALEPIKKIAGDIRAAHARRTLPWLNTGERLLPLAGYEQYGEEIAGLRAAFEREVENFISLYPTLIEDARRRLNGMFDEADYPPVSELRDRFQIELKIMPLPNTRSWITDEIKAVLGAQAEELREAAEERLQVAVQDATKDIFTRIAAVTGHMATKLKGYNPDTEGRPEGVFRDSLVENVRELYALLPALNFTGDPQLEALRAEMHALTHHDADTLRADAAFRSETAEAADAIYQKAMALLG